MQEESAQMRTSDESNDAELFQGFLSDDPQAKSDFIRRWEMPMYRIALRIVGQAADAEEVRQAVLLKMLQRPEVLPQPQRIATWIRRCVINESLTFLRKRLRFAHADLVDCETNGTSVDRSDETVLLKSALEGFPPDARALLALRFDEGLTVRQIASIVNKPRSTVHAQLQSAIQSLRKKLISN